MERMIRIAFVTASLLIGSISLFHNWGYAYLEKNDCFTEEYYMAEGFQADEVTETEHLYETDNLLCNYNHWEQDSILMKKMNKKRIKQEGKDKVCTNEQISYTINFS